MVLPLNSLSRFFEYTQLARKDESLLTESPASRWISRARTLRNRFADVIGDYLGRMRTLGHARQKCTTRSHSEALEPPFEPEPFSDHYRRSLYHGMVSMTDRVFEQLRGRVGELAGRSCRGCAARAGAP